MKKLAIFLGIVLGLIMLVCVAIFALRKPLIKKLADGAILAIQKDIGREISVEEYDISGMGELQLRNVCISQKPSFSNGTFLCAEAASFKPGTSKDGKTLNVSLELSRAELNANEAGGHWDFDDLVALGDKSNDSGTEWEIGTVKITNSKANIKSKSKNIQSEIRDVDMTIKNTGTEISAEGKADIRIDTENGTAHIPTILDISTSFNEKDIHSAKGKITFNKASFGKITFDKFMLDADLEGITSPRESKNYSARFEASGIEIPADDTFIYEKVPEYLKLFAAAVGRPAPVIKDAEFHTIKGHLTVHNRSVGLSHFAIRSNFMETDGNISINTKDRKSQSDMKISIGHNSINLRIYGPIGKPEIEPVLAETISKNLKKSYTDFEKSLLEYFPN